MATIRKATVKSYSAATHKATVQVAGSLGVWLDAIRVATDIPAADVVAGRQCTVLFLDPANQDDAVIITIQGALPSGGGGGTTDHAALTNLAYATAAHTGFETPTGAQAKVDTHAAAADPHTQYGALAQAETWAALQTFSLGLKLAAAQTIQDSGGTGRILLATALPNLTITGSVRIDGNVAIDGDPLTSPDQKLTIAPIVTGVTDWRGIMVEPGLTLTGNSGYVAGIGGAPGITVPAASSGHRIFGLDYSPFVMPVGAATVSELNAVRAAPSAIASSGALTVTEINALKGDPSVHVIISPATSTITTLRGAFLKGATINNARLTITTVESLRVEDWAGSSVGTCRLVEVGGTVPYLRVVGKASPGANQTNLYVNEGGVLRRVQWKAGDALVAGDKVMVLV